MNKNIVLLFLLLTPRYTQAHQEFILITTLYNETNKCRQHEYITCLKKNMVHPDIKRIHIIYDISKDNATEESTILKYILSQELTISYITGRPTYKDCFDLANELYSNEDIILTNADIYFNETLHLLRNFNLTNYFIALTRWNITKDGNLKKHKVSCSQDTWIFSTPIKQFKKANIHIGTQHCDGRIAFQAHKENMIVINPCLSIQCCHLHLSNIRNYSINKPPQSPLMPIPHTKLK